MQVCPRCGNLMDDWLTLCENCVNKLVIDEKEVYEAIEKAIETLKEIKEKNSLEKKEKKK